MDDDATLAAVMRRIMSRQADWSLTWTELSLSTTVPLTPEERDAIGRATGMATVANPWLRSNPNRPSPDVV
jgi:hypothetical protein